ncbi:hypothetical protein BpHYR1_047623 [Brachionus plicatilis]|uniref:Tubulin/FtsZ GTPase domain-containing protein n=1 Tax=Brachionus plicatilis TaxID=10195 RepID=A0A3M7PFV3_BRAPC|nr:hypothetical protein BpHYR1_047623 [Brachionus plicatilis]
MDSIRKEAESSDMVMFQFISAIGGGTGSGLGVLWSLSSSKNFNFFSKFKDDLVNSAISKCTLQIAHQRNGAILDG